MSSLKVLSIIGICLAVLSFIIIAGYNNSYDYEISVGWGIIACLYLGAFSIVGLVKK